MRVASLLLLFLGSASAFGAALLPSLRTCFGSARLRAANFASKSSRTKMSASPAPFNFAPVSARDDNVFGSHRPGFLPNEENEKPGAVDDKLVGEWCEFIKGKGVTKILSFLEDNEIAWYNTPLSQQLEAQGFSEASGTYVRSPLSTPDGAKVAVKTLIDAKEKGEKIVLHCSGGIGRTGLLSAVYLVKQYGLSAEDAVKEVSEQAEKLGVERKTKAEKVTKTLETV